MKKDVAQTCNKKEGFKVEAKSAGDGNLVNIDDTKLIPYQIRYDNSALLSLLSAISTQVKHVPLLTKKTTVNSEVFISFVGNPDALAGDFVDTITFTISAN